MLCCSDCVAQPRVICFLDCGTRGDVERWAQFSNGDNSLLDQTKCSGDAADGVVNLFWSVQRNDDVVEAFDDLSGLLLQQEAGCEQGEADVFGFEDGAELRPFAIE